MIPHSLYGEPYRSNPIHVDNVLSKFSIFPVAVARGKHPFPFRTRQLSPSAPMVLRALVRGRVGRRREVFLKGPGLNTQGLRFLSLQPLQVKLPEGYDLENRMRLLPTA